MNIPKRFISSLLFSAIFTGFACFSFTVIAASLDKEKPKTKTGFQGYAAIEARGFIETAQYPNQKDGSIPSAIIEPEFYAISSDKNDIFTARGFFHYDPNDNARTHADIRQLDVVSVRGDWEVRAGIGKVYWGTTESRHLVDIINQVDGVEDIDDEDRLGQPMLQLATFQDWGTLRLFYLPYFRERTFAGKQGRLRGPFLIDTNNAKFSTGAGEWSPSAALRYEHSFGDFDIGLAHFYGTGREPTFRASNGILTPFYELTHQSSFEGQYTTGAWLWKLEGIYRRGQASPFFATTGGFEYSFYGIFDTDHDLGVLAEYHYDGRDVNAPVSTLEHDLFLGGRYTLNDIYDSALLAGITTDVTDGSQLIVIEASRRLTNNLKLEIDGRFIMNQDNLSPLYAIRQDDFIQGRLSYYF